MNSSPAAATAVSGSSVARFRISTAGGLDSFGLGADGEVEDHSVTILATPGAITVDDNYAGSSLGDSIDGGTFGIDRFAIIQNAVNVVSTGGTITLNPGTYNQSATIDRDVSLIGSKLILIARFDDSRPCRAVRKPAQRADRHRLRRCNVPQLHHHRWLQRFRINVNRLAFTDERRRDQQRVQRSARQQQRRNQHQQQLVHQ